MTPQPISVQQGARATPVAYTFADEAIYMLESATAHFDGSGASDAFLPSIAVYSPGGTLLSRTFPAIPVAAGEEADVTFAPFLGGLGGAGPASFGAVKIPVPSPKTVAASTVAAIGWNTFRTNDPSVFATSDDGVTVNNTAGDTFLLCRKQGLYLAIASLQWDDDTADLFTSIDFDSDTSIIFSIGQAAVNAVTPGSFWTYNAFLLASAGTTPTAFFKLEAHNGDAGSSHDVEAAFLTVVHFPQTAGARVYP